VERVARLEDGGLIAFDAVGDLGFGWKGEDVGAFAVDGP
jgi:hypothetical protein